MITVLSHAALFIRLRQMQGMQTIVTDGCSVCLSVCLSVTKALNDPSSASLCWIIGSGACSVHNVPCLRGHSVQPSPNAFGLLLLMLTGGCY